MISAPVEPAVRDETETISVSLKLRDDDSFDVDYADLAAPEAATPGRLVHDAARAPSATRLLGASIALCLAASLLHCLRRGRVAVNGLEATAVVTVQRNEKGRLRVRRVNVLLDPGIDPEHAGRFERCGALFEDYCTVTESVRQGIDVRVTVAAT